MNGLIKLKSNLYLIGFLTISSYCLIKYLNKRLHWLQKLQAYYNQNSIQQVNFKFNTIKLKYIYEQLVKYKQQSNSNDLVIFEIGVGCGANIDYYLPG